MKLTHKIALITGAGSGIGAATARLMTAAGAKVVCAGIPATGVQAVADELNAAGHTALAILTDVADSQQLAAA